ncbi:MAG: triose-phosphate isomerase [Candidatus Omnitrophota bacterium]
MRKPIIAGNWKMHNTIKEAVGLVNGLKRELSSITEVDIVVCPTYTALSDVNELLVGSNIKLGAQDVYWEEKGAFTGEVSSQMLKDTGCSYVIIGHSERRIYFYETNETVNKKLKAVLAAGLLPIVCVGEQLEEREAGKTFDVVKNHVEGSLSGLSSEDIKKTIIAYEPVWAIGTGKTATPKQAEEVHKYIRELVAKLFGEEIAAGVRIQYGGSVKPENVKEIMAEEDVDGALVGGASLKIDLFSHIVKGAVR